MPLSRMTHDQIGEGDQPPFATLLWQTPAAFRTVLRDDDDCQHVWPWIRADEAIR